MKQTIDLGGEGFIHIKSSGTGNKFGGGYYIQISVISDLNRFADILLSPTELKSLIEALNKQYNEIKTI